MTWQRLYADSLPPVDAIVLVGPSGGQLLAMGVVSYCPTYCVSSDWFLLTSPDGISWSVLGQLPGEPNSISTVFDSQFGYFAGGSIEPDGVEGPVGIWWSKTGANWTSLADEDAFQLNNCQRASRGQILNFYSTDNGLAASGTGTWFSSDGKLWQCESDQLLFQVAASSGAYAAAGESSGTPALWSSTDGLKWTVAQTLPTDVGVAAVAKGFVALYDNSPMTTDDRLTFTSPDGQKWSQQEYPFGPDEVSGLASDGNRAAVVDPPGGKSGPPAPGTVWVSSSDGSSWTSYQLPTGDGDEVDGGVALFGDTVVVSGDAGRHGSVLWVAKIP